MIEKKNPVEEAKRYVDNAKKLLTEYGELDVETRFYSNREYVKMAGDMLWKGVLLILDEVFHVRKDRRTRVHIDDYINVVNKRDDKLSKYVHTGYEIMYIIMGYDGTTLKATCDEGFRIANEIIDRCSKLKAES